MANGDLIKLGTLYMGATKIPRPSNPWRNDSEPYVGSGIGNIQNFTAGATLEIRNTEAADADKMQWIEVNDGGKKYLVADRAMLVNISWDDLNAQSLVAGKTVTIDGQQYLLRLLTGGSNYRSGTDAYSGGTPTTNEWDKWITNESVLSGLPTPNATDLDSTLNNTDKNGAHNLKWNWMGVYSWAQETYTGNSASRAFRGYNSARNWNRNTASYRYTNVGWRPALEVLNSAPVVSGSDSNLGNKSTSFTTDYTVTDSDASDTLTVTEKVDTTTIRTVNNAVRGQAYTADLASIWATLSLGSHSLIITVTDGKGGTTTRTHTFTKTDDRVKFSIKNPVQTSIAAKSIVVSGVITVPAGATLNVKACNNGFDTSPTWEDITTKFLNKEAHSFSNVAKTATNWGINVQFEILKGTATEQIVVDGFGFSFE